MPQLFIHAKLNFGVKRRLQRAGKCDFGLSSVRTGLIPEQRIKLSIFVFSGEDPVLRLSKSMEENLVFGDGLLDQLF